MPEPKPLLQAVPPLKKEPPIIYKPVLSATQRKAYAAAHRIFGGDHIESKYACPSYRRTRAIDKIAAIIEEEMTR